MGTRIVMRGLEMTVYLGGEIDHHTAREMRESIDTFIQTHNPQLMKMDFSGVTFMDSSGIGLVIGRYRMMSLFGGQLIVINVPPHLQRIFNLSGLTALNVFDTERGKNCEIRK